MKDNQNQIISKRAMKYLLIILVLITVFVLLQIFPVNKQSKTVFLKDGKRPLVIAHRGGAGLAPENTLLAFKIAEKLNVDAIELDVRLSKDKQLVVIHDATIDRTTDGTGYVSELTVDELKAYDAGYYLKTDEGSYPFRNKGITIPTLEEVFQNVKKTPLIIELKDANHEVEKKVAKLIKKYNMKKRVIVGSFHDASLERFANQTDGKIPIGSGVETVKYYVFFHILHLDRLFPLESYAVQIPLKAGNIDLATKRFIKSIQERNIAIQFWTINDERTMKKLIELNVDGIITDYPNKLLRLLEKKNNEV